jgi:hypothetical protein
VNVPLCMSFPVRIGSGLHRAATNVDLATAGGFKAAALREVMALLKAVSRSVVRSDAAASDCALDRG